MWGSNFFIQNHKKLTTLPEGGYWWKIILKEGVKYKELWHRYLFFFSRRRKKERMLTMASVSLVRFENIT